MRCPNCQHDNRAGARFCDHCGAPLIASAAESGGVTAQRDIVVAGDTVARDKIVTIVNHI